MYTLLEILAVPAVPLTMTAGVIFGPVAGSIVVSVAATAAATIAFLIARYAGALAPAALACRKQLALWRRRHSFRRCVPTLSSTQAGGLPLHAHPARHLAVRCCVQRHVLMQCCTRLL